MNNKFASPLLLTPEEKKWFTLILIISAVQFLLNDKMHTAFEWTTLQFMPVSLRLLDPSFLQYDFYTNAVSETIACIFASTVNVLIYLGLSWYEAFYAFKVLIFILMKPMLALGMMRIVSYWSNKDDQSPLCEFLRWGIVVVVLFPWFLRAFFAAPAGWWPLQFNTFVAPMTLALLLGFIYLFLTFSIDKRAQWVSFAFLFCCTLIHPTIGVGCLMLRILFSFNKKEASMHILQLIVGIGVPVGILLCLSSSTSGGITAAEFADVYVYTRHPHHYLMSASFTRKRLLALVVLYLVFIGVALWRRDKSLILLSVLCLLSFVMPIAVQYIFSEVYPSKPLMTFGASRLTGLGSIVMTVEACIFAIRLNVFKSVFQSIASLRLASAFTSKYQVIWNDRYFNFRGLGLIGVLLGLGIIFGITSTHPLETINGKRFKPCVEWMKAHLPEDAVVFTHYNVLPSYYVRLFANRAIWADLSFPHNESVALEFKRRYLIEKEFPNFNKEDIENLFDEGVTHIILGNKERAYFPGRKPLFQDGNCYIDTAESLGL